MSQVKSCYKSAAHALAHALCKPLASSCCYWYVAGSFSSTEIDGFFQLLNSDDVIFLHNETSTRPAPVAPQIAVLQSQYSLLLHCGCCVHVIRCKTTPVVSFHFASESDCTTIHLTTILFARHARSLSRPASMVESNYKWLPPWRAARSEWGRWAKGTKYWKGLA